MFAAASRTNDTVIANGAIVRAAGSGSKTRTRSPA